MTTLTHALMNELILSQLMPQDLREEEEEDQREEVEEIELPHVPNRLQILKII